jgi:purine-cytosine permease-like protein
MTVGNWIFWSVIVWLGVNFIWLGIFPDLPAWIGAIIATILAIVTFIFGPRPKSEEE